MTLSEELIDNWCTMTYRNKPFKINDGGQLLLFTSEPPGIEPTHSSLVVVDVWVAIVEGAHPSVFVLTPNCPRKAVANKVRVIELSGLPQLREIINNKRGKQIRHFTDVIYKGSQPHPTLCGAVKYTRLRRLFFTDQPQVWHLGRTNDTCSTCKQKIRELFDLKKERFHSVISYTSIKETPDDTNETTRGLVFFQDNRDGKNARIIVLDPIRTNWPRNRTGELTVGSDTFFVGCG